MHSEKSALKPHLYAAVEFGLSFKTSVLLTAPPVQRYIFCRVSCHEVFPARDDFVDRRRLAVGSRSEFDVST
jgi:hypothetical protein